MNNQFCVSGGIYVDPSGFVINKNKFMDGREEKNTKDELMESFDRFKELHIRLLPDGGGLSEEETDEYDDLRRRLHIV